MLRYLCCVKDFSRSLNAIYGRQPSAGSAPMMDAKGEHLITNKGKIPERWGEHFDNVLNHPSSINEEAINRIPQNDMNPSLALLPTLDEVNKAIASLSSGKAHALMEYPQRSSQLTVQLL